jgi:hypothetical protein
MARAARKELVMLDDKLGVLTGRITGQRVLPSADQPRVEVSAEVSGEIGGIPTQIMASYWAKVRADGTLYGECPEQGLVITDDGSVGTYAAAGVGWFTEGGGTSFRGAIYLVNPPPKLAHLATTALVFEWDVAADQSATLALWGWK